MGKLARTESFMVGIVLFIASLYILLKDVHVNGTSHATSATVGGLMLLLGLAFMMPVLTFQIAKKVLDLVGPYLPQVMIGGRRATDPPPNRSSEITDDPNHALEGKL